MVWKEIIHSFRQLRKAPGFTLLAILTLALGIGGSTAVFTIVDSVILKPLSYRNSGQLVVLWERVKFLGSGYTGPNPRHAAMWRDRATGLNDLALLRQGARGVSLNPIEHPRLIGTVSTYGNLLQILQVKPLLGRDFRPEDAIKGHENIVIITYGLWQGLFHGDPGVLGRTLLLTGVRCEIVGVLPESFQFPKRNILSSFPSSQGRGEAQEVEILRPVPMNPNDYGWNSDYGNWLALARLKPGVTVKQAEAALNSIDQQIVREMPADQRPTDPHNALESYIQPMQEAMVGNAQNGLWLLLAAVAGLLLIACVNLANAQLARSISREREAAVRSALGANGWQLIWSSLAENLILAVGGGIAGVWLADLAVSAFLRYTPLDLPRMTEIHLNVSVLVFAAVLIISSGLAFGLLPSLKFLRVDPQGALQSNNGRTQGTREGRGVRSWLIGFQVFACTTLLLVTGLFTRNFMRLLESEKGFATDHVTIAEVTPSGAAVTNDNQRVAAIDAVLARLRMIPGVQSASLVSAMPLEGETWINGVFRADRPTRNAPLSNWRWVSPGYFETIREPLIAGRSFDDHDRNAKSIIISQATALHVWPGEDPIGKQIHWRDSNYTVIGIVADARNNSLKLPPANMVYFHYADWPQYPAFFLVRSPQSTEVLAPSIRKAIWDTDATATIARIKSLDTQMADSLASERFQTTLLVAFGTIALLLAMLGIYGILSYTVATRKQEIGLRMALGATRERIYALVMSEATLPVLAGLSAGWAASLAASRVVQTLLYSVKQVDGGLTLAVVTLFLVAAGIAAFLPTRRAAGIAPMEALREE